MLDPFYLALGAFAIFSFAVLSFSACVRKYRLRRRNAANRRMSPFVSDTSVNDSEARVYDGPISLYEAKANFEYDPDLLVNTKLNVY